MIKFRRRYFTRRWNDCFQNSDAHHGHMFTKRNVDHFNCSLSCSFISSRSLTPLLQACEPVGNCQIVTDRQNLENIKTVMRALLLCVIVISFEFIPTTQARGKKILNFRPCQPRVLEATALRLPGCPRMPFPKFRIYACYGYCESESISRTDRTEIVHHCKCCQATETRKFKMTTMCRNQYREMTFLTAIRCECRKCTPLTR